MKRASETMNTGVTNTFVMKRLANFYFTYSTQLKIAPENNEEAGMILSNNGSHFDFRINKKDKKKRLFVKFRVESTSYIPKETVPKLGFHNFKIKEKRTNNHLNPYLST